MEFREGDRIQWQGRSGWVYQDQNRDRTVKVVMDDEPNIVTAVWPNEVRLVERVK